MRLQAANRVFLGVSRRGAVRETDCVYPYAIPRRSGHSGCETRRYWQHGGALCARSLERYRADALTVNPYLGTDSIAPYFAHPDKGVIVLCRTSNEGGAEVQLQRAGNAYIYQIIAQRAVKQ